MSIIGKVRKLVSQDRIRFQEGGFDLDLCYVTRNIVGLHHQTHSRNALPTNSHLLRLNDSNERAVDGDDSDVAQQHRGHQAH